MQLTPQDLKLVERLRKQERRWPRDRWILLLVGIFSLACYGYIVTSLYCGLDFENLQSINVLVFAVLWPKCLMMFLFAVYFIGWAIRDWNGNANRRLLLRLLEEHQIG
jgi:hypothetical protein